MLPGNAVFLLLSLGLPTAFGAEEPAAVPLEPVRERINGATPEEMAAFEEIVARYDDRMGEFKEDIRRFVKARQEETRKQVEESYKRTTDGLTEEEKSLRELAKTRFEAFLEKYPQAEYTPHVMFRLAELYFEDAENRFQVETAEYDRLATEHQGDEETLPPEPRKDYGKSLALYERIRTEFPGYERSDGVLYMLGFCYLEGRAVNRDDGRGRDAFEALLARYPKSDFANDANFRLGEFYFINEETERAIAYYEKIVAGGEEGRRFDKALYKLAWSHYKLANVSNVGEYRHALDLFVRLLDYSQRLLLLTGKPSATEAEATQYAAVSFADVSDARQEPAVVTVRNYFKEVGDRPYEVEIVKKLAKILEQQARREDAIEAYRYLQDRWPLEPDNPKYQHRIAQLYLKLPTGRDDVASSNAVLELARRYNDESEWWQANRTTHPDALAEARSFIEQSLAEVAKDFHIKAQQSKRPEDYSFAAEKYKEYLRKFPFAKDYYEMEFYLAEALLDANRLQEAEQEYEQLLKAGRHEFGDMALYKLMQTRKRILVNLYGKVEGKPENPVLEKEVKTPFGSTVKVFMLTDEQKAFIEVADQLVATNLTDPDVVGPVKKDLAALMYIPGQILFENGHFDEARTRLFKVVGTFPERDEGAYSANLIVRMYTDENDLENVRRYTAEFAKKRLGSSKEVIAENAVFKDLEEGAAFKLASKLIETDQREEAAKAFLKFCEEYPNSTHAKKALFNAANSLEIIGKADEANRYFEDFINKYPKDESSKGLYFRIASNYASVLELDKAIMYYRRLVQNFPDAVDSPAALFNAAFLQIGVGRYQGAAEDFELYATKYPNQGDAEIVFFKAGEQWENVGDDQALSFYRRYLKRYPGTNADRSLQSQYKIVKLLEKSGQVKLAEKEWTNLSAMYDGFQQAGTPVSPTERGYAAEAEFRGIADALEAFKVIKYVGDAERDGVLLRETKKKEREALEARCLALIQKYQDFVYTSAALYVQAEAFYAYAAMLYNVPTPKGLPPEMEDYFREKLDEIREPAEEKGKAFAMANLDKARESRSWSVWQGKTLDLLNEHFPSEFPREKVEEHYSTRPRISAVVGPMTIPVPEIRATGGGQ